MKIVFRKKVKINYIYQKISTHPFLLPSISHDFAKVYPGVKLMVRAPGNSNSSLAENKHYGKNGKKKYLGHSVNFHLACLDSSIIKLPSESYIFFLNVKGEIVKFCGKGKKLFTNNFEGRKNSLRNYSNQKSCFPFFFERTALILFLV